MDVSGVFNKLRNTLTSTVSEISAALPGNPLLREYDAGEQVGSAGSRFLWKIYEGTKKSTKAEVAIWVLEKKQLDQFGRTDRDVILDVLRRGCTQMTKIRHPRILTVEHSLEESRDSIVFCTEPVFASLANALGKHSNIVNPSKELQQYDLHEVEIKYGMMQISEALSFLHTGVKMVHGNISPESIIINKEGAWKIAGFDFCIANSGSMTDLRFVMKDWDTSLPSPSLPNPNYLAPEYILRKSCDTASDLFSLGMLLHAVYNRGRTLFPCGTDEIYKKMPSKADQLENLTNTNLEKIPSEVRDHEKMLLHPDPNVRPDADQMAKLPFFSHVGVMTLQYLDTLLQRENLQKSQFFKGLPKVLPQLPKRVVMKRVLPCLTSEFTNCDMIPFVLPNIIMIAETCSKEEFNDIIFPSLVPVFKIQRPIQVLLILLQKMDLLLAKTPSDKIQAHILPMLASALDAPVQIQELSMSIIPSFAERLDLSSVKNSVLPRIRKIALEGETLAIRVHALICTGKLIFIFDKWFVQDEVLSFLHRIQSREPAILMAILGIYQTILKSDKLAISKEVMAAKSLPFLIPLSVEGNLNLKQYLSFVHVIKEMMQRVEKEHTSKLEQLSKMQLEQDAALDFTKVSSLASSQAATIESVDEMFSSTKLAESQPEVSSRQHLTLEEKQKLVKMKEQENRMKKEGVMKPLNLGSSNTKQPNVGKSKDLTSSLMERNLQGMNSRSMGMTSQPFQTNLGTSMMTSGASPMNYGQKPMMSSTAMTPQFGSMTSPNSSQWNPAAGTVGMNSAPYGMSNSTPFSSHQNGFGSRTTGNSMISQGNFTTSQPTQKNMSSLDNIFSMPSQQRKPMNQMGKPMMQTNRMMAQTPMMSQSPMMSQTSMMPQNNFMMQQNQANSNQMTNNRLSKEDLLDFLG